MEFMVSALVQDWIIRKCMENDLYILLNRYNWDFCFIQGKNNKNKDKHIQIFS